MTIFQSLAKVSPGEWQEYAGYQNEQRKMEPVGAVKVMGSVNVVFIPGEVRALFVIGETPEAIASIKTDFRDGCLYIQNERVTQSFGGFNNVFYGNVGSTLSVPGNCTMVMDGSSIKFIDSDGRVVTPDVGSPGAQLGRTLVALSMPEAPRFNLVGSGDITLLELDQPSLSLSVQGSGDITATGKVNHLVAAVAGSGDIKARELNAFSADLSVAGSGDIKAYVRAEANAKVAGSGDIIVYGNPATQRQSVVGSGRVKFK